MRKKRGFTLIELLVVISIIALLLSILMPSLSLAKQKASGVVCLSNEKQLSLAWTLFASDNDDEIVDGQPDQSAPYNGFTDYPQYGRHANFVADPHNEAGDPDYTLESRIRGFEKGGLWPYLESYKIFHCPGDRRSTKDELQYGYRTYSIGAVYSRIFSFNSTSQSDEHKVYVTKTSRIRNPGTKFVFLEEMDVQNEFNGNTWNIYLNRAEWFDPLAVWHGDSSTFGFADGHADRHKWVGEEVLKRADFGAAIELLAQGGTQKKSGILTDPKDIEDWTWVAKHYVPGLFNPNRK